MPGRNYTDGTGYRYGYQNSEKDDEISTGTYTTYFRELDTRLGRWWQVDPIFKPHESPYASMSNNPIMRIDPKGDDDYTIDSKGHINLTKKTDAKNHTIYNADNSSSYNVGLDFFKTKSYGSKTDKTEKKEVTFIVSSNLKELEGAYKFFSANSSVEWNYATFQDKGTAGVLLTTHTEGKVRYWGLDLHKKILDSHPNAKMLFDSHSHPGVFAAWSTWPAYPSGFKYTGQINEKEEGDRDVFKEMKDKYKNRIPSMFNIYVPGRPQLEVSYDDKIFIQTPISTDISPKK